MSLSLFVSPSTMLTNSLNTRSSKLVMRIINNPARVREGDLRVIRPLVYVREKQLRHFAELRRLPVIPENCPACFEVPKVSRPRVRWRFPAPRLLPKVGRDPEIDG